MYNNCLLKLPDIIIKCEDLSKYSEYENMLYEIFKSLYESVPLIFNGIPVHMKHYPPNYDVRSGFYHIICENYNHTGSEEDRNPNLKRCERIKWPKEIMENHSTCCGPLYIWENTRHSKNNILIFCKNLKYLIVLSKRNNYYLFTTAYPIEHAHRENKLMKEYNEYIKNKQRL